MILSIKRTIPYLWTRAGVKKALLAAITGQQFRFLGHVTGNEGLESVESEREYLLTITNLMKLTLIQMYIQINFLPRQGMDLL